jgi:hypothetical protein
MTWPLPGAYSTSGECPWGLDEWEGQAQLVLHTPAPEKSHQNWQMVDKLSHLCSAHPSFISSTALECGFSLNLGRVGRQLVSPLPFRASPRPCAPGIWTSAGPPKVPASATSNQRHDSPELGEVIRSTLCSHARIFSLVSFEGPVGMTSTSHHYLYTLGNPMPQFPPRTL